MKHWLKIIKHAAANISPVAAHSVDEGVVSRGSQAGQQLVQLCQAVLR
jgi:hypothetical protein